MKLNFVITLIVSILLSFEVSSAKSESQTELAILKGNFINISTTHTTNYSGETREKAVEKLRLKVLLLGFDDVHRQETILPLGLGESALLKESASIKATLPSSVAHMTSSVIYRAIICFPISIQKFNWANPDLLFGSALTCV
jgi:hypothetical protein